MSQLFSTPYVEIPARIVQFGVLCVNTYELATGNELTANLVFPLHLSLPL